MSPKTVIVNGTQSIPPAPLPTMEPQVDVLQTLQAQIDALRGEVLGQMAKAQGFFDALISERNKPHCGQQWRDMVDGLTRRAREAGLWSPKDC